MEKLKHFLLNNRFNLSILIIWFLIALITMLNHEIWRDEAQVWCLVRDLSFFDILKASRIEGHPILWYLLVMPFAKLNLPVLSMQILSLVLTFSAVVFFIFKSPFDKFFKIIIIYSSGMLYFLSIIARNYSLVPIFLFLLAYLYPNRKEKPFLYVLLIILLSNTHFLMFGFCLILAVLFIIEQLSDLKTSKQKEGLQINSIKILAPIIILMLNFLILFLLFSNTPTDNFVIKNYVTKHLTLSLPEILNKYCLIYFLPFMHKYPIINYLIFYSSIGIILYSLLKLNKKSFLIFFFSFIYFVFIFAKVWFNGMPYQKGYLLLLILVFCVWITQSGMQSKQKEISYPLLASTTYKLLYVFTVVLLLISMIFSPIVILDDINNNFSGGKQTAQFIQKNLNNEDTFIVLGYPFTFSSISAYLPDKKLYYYHKNYYITYFDFKDLRNNYDEKFPENAVYYIVQDDLYLREDLGFKSIFTSDEKNISSSVNKEIFTIYEKI